MTGWTTILAAAAILVAHPPTAAAQADPVFQLHDDAKRREIVLELGPVDLPAASSEAGHSGHDAAGASHTGHLTYAREGTLPIAGWLHGYGVELADAEGNPVPRSLIHHVNVIAADRRELFSQIMLRIAAAGKETAPVRLPRVAGFRVERGERILLSTMLHNPTATSYRGVYLRVRMPYTRSGTWLKPASVFPFYLDVMPPAGIHAYDLPPGPSSRSWEARPGTSGRILGVSGHLHRYGVSLRLDDVTTGKRIWEGRPRFDAEGEVVGMPVSKFYARLGIPIRAGHVYRLTAFYDNPTGATIPQGAMGALGGVVWVREPKRWPRLDRSHPEFLRDIEVTLGKPPEAAEGGHHHHPSDHPGAAHPHPPPSSP